MKLIGLSRTIALTMAAMAFGITLFVVAASYVFYFIAFHFWEGSVSDPNMFPTGPEWAWLAGTTLVGLAFAVIVGSECPKTWRFGMRPSPMSYVRQ